RLLFNTRGAAAVPRIWPCASLQDELAGVFRNAVDPHLVVEVRSGRAAGIPDGADLLPPGHAIAPLHVEFGQVRETRLDAEAVVDDENLSVGALRAREDHHAIRGRDHGRPVAVGDVD